MANLKEVLVRPTVTENYSRNAFDRSQSVNFTYQLGGLQPFFAEPFIAGSHVKLNRSLFQRTAAVRTPAFPTVDTHCEFFFVPLRLIMSNWSNFKLNIQDFNSSMFLNSDNDGVTTAITPQVPVFNLYDVRSNIRSFLYGDTSSNPLRYYFNNSVSAVGALRLLDSLGYGFVNRDQPVYTEETEANVPTRLVNPFKLAAYQKIYFDHFRNTSYEGNNPSYYNLDRWADSVNSNLPAQIVSRLFTYRYVNYRKDYFQSVYPSLNYSLTSPNGLDWTIPNSVVYQFTSTSPGGTSSSSDVVASSSGNGQVLLRSVLSSSAGLSISTVQQVRAAFALDKLLRVSAYTPKHVKDQFEARYGVKNVESGNESIRIGAFMNDVIFHEVTNTGEDLGAIGGKGIGSSQPSEDIEFTCKEDGIIMGLCYSMPRTSYDSDSLRNWNGKISRESFFIPEFMNLGLQPMYVSEFRLYNSDPLLQNNNIVGFKPRYSEYKVGIDQNFGIFNRDHALSDFVVHSNSTTSLASGSGVNSNYFKVKPTDMDSIFAENTLTNSLDTDKFITHIDVKCVCNQDMSIHGMPVNIGS